VITAEKVGINCGHCQILIRGHLRVLVSKHATACPFNLRLPRFGNQTFSGELQESVLFEMTDKSPRVKLVIKNLLEHSLNQQISHFRSFNSARKAIIDESFGSSAVKPDISLPNIR